MGALFMLVFELVEVLLFTKSQSYTQKSKSVQIGHRCTNINVYAYIAANWNLKIILDSTEYQNQKYNEYGDFLVEMNSLWLTVLNEYLMTGKQ